MGESGVLLGAGGGLRKGQAGGPQARRRSRRPGALRRGVPPSGRDGLRPDPGTLQGDAEEAGVGGQRGFAGGGREAEAGGRHPAGTGRPAGQPARRAGLGGGRRPPPTAAKPPALRACVLPIWQGAVSGGAFVLEPAQKFAEGAATLCILAADMIR